MFALLQVQDPLPPDTHPAVAALSNMHWAKYEDAEKALKAAAEQAGFGVSKSCAESKDPVLDIYRRHVFSCWKAKAKAPSRTKIEAAAIAYFGVPASELTVEQGAVLASIIKSPSGLAPEESLPERFATRMGWPHASELALGAELVRRVQGRCDLILHGHRHLPREFDLGAFQGRGLRIYNSGSSIELGRFRLFQHAAGRLVGEPAWQQTALPPAPKRSAPNVMPALQYLASQLAVSLF